MVQYEYDHDVDELGNKWHESALSDAVGRRQEEFDDVPHLVMTLFASRGPFGTAFALNNNRCHGQCRSRLHPREG